MSFYAPVTDSLNEILRRFRQYKTEHDWTDAVLDGAASFASGCALFRLEGTNLRALGQRRLNLPPDFTLPILQARAFSTAVEFMDSSVTLRIPSEVGQQLSSNERMDRAHIIPIVRGSRAVAFLYSEDGEDTDASGLELIAGIASLALRTADPSTVQIQPLPTDAFPIEAERPSAPIPSVRVPDWVNLKPEERTLHTRAQRFARNRVAQICLAHPEAVEEGLKQGDLYLFLKKQIDAARDEYRALFMEHRNMLDYIHSELVRVAGNDEMKLGAEYPGQMD